MPATGCQLRNAAVSTKERPGLPDAGCPSHLPEMIGGPAEWMGRQYVTVERPGATVTVVASPEKRRALRAQGALNPAPEKVLAEPFRSHPEFFDAEDRLQVRYEMLRGPSQGEMSVVEACRLFAVSRQTFYTLRRAFEARGIPGLPQGKRGRHGPLKASREVVEVVRAPQATAPLALGA